MKFDILKIMELQFDILPIAVQEYINDNEWEKIIANLSSNFRLNKDQREAIEAVTLYTMVGVAKKEDFVQSIMDDAKIDAGIANEIAKGINLNIFDEIAQIKTAVEQEQSRGLAGDDSLLILDDARDTENKMTPEERKLMNEYDDVRTTENKITPEERRVMYEYEEKQKPAEIPELKKTDPNNRADMEAEALLNEIENHRENLPQTTGERANTILQNNVDTLMGQRPSGDSVAPGAVNNQQPQVDPQEFAGEDTKRPATHMRTLKSDIVREKLDNPSWAPDTREVRDPEMKEITEEALKQASPQAGLPHQNNDPYREITQ